MDKEPLFAKKDKERPDAFAPEKATQSNAIKIPAITLPKGGAPERY